MKTNYFLVPFALMALHAAAQQQGDPKLTEIWSVSLAHLIAVPLRNYDHDISGTVGHALATEPRFRCQRRGFVECERYNADPDPKTLWFEKHL